ncbi:3-hydroxybutyryl-CoA dehydrogenase [Massilia sp. UYP11]|uniref:3-hydroxyacyl-CoA dehydrogenase NAD-binding domain-containing protein n=1 Tax=Massilia sp. UYP11 TaxID=1756385 RepID=UPI003D1E7434
MNNTNTGSASTLATAPQSDGAMDDRLRDHRQIHTDPQVRTLTETAGFSEQPANDAVRPVGRVGIMGAHGASINLAMGLLDAGMPVTVFDKRDALDQGLALLRSRYEQSLVSGALAAGQRDWRLALCSATARFHHLKDCDLVIDMMSVETQLRERFFRRLDEIGKSSAILIVNASGCGVDRVARVTRRPADVLGLRFSNPVDPSEKLVLVRGRETSGEAYATTAGLFSTIGKLAEE